MKRLFTVAILSTYFFSTNILQAQEQSSQPADTIAKDLHEIVIEAQNQRTSATLSTYLPTSKAKDASQNAIDLLHRMAIPEILINPITKSITTASGQDVSIFINYLPATDNDLTGMRTADVRKVEYLDYPLDPRFRGVQHAINIIVQEYEYGGYTKISDYNYVYDDYTNDGQIYSKFAYRKMIYDLNIANDFVTSKNVGISEYSTFQLPMQEVERRQQWLSSDFKYIIVPISFRASYNTDNMQIVNTIGYNFHDNYACTRNGLLTISPSSANTSYNYSKLSPYINRTLSWSGEYFFALPKEWSFTADPTFTYGHNNTNSDYSTTVPGSSAIVNNAREDSYHLRLSTNIVKNFNEKNAATLSVDGGTIINHVNYSGSTEYYTNFSNSFATAGIGYTFNGTKVSINADAGLVWEFQRTNGIAYDDNYPYVHLSTSYSPNQKNRLSLWLQYATNSPDVEERSPNTIQSNEFLYYTGNPILKNSRHTTVHLNYTHLHSNKFQLTTYATYFGLYNNARTYYELMPDQSAILRSYINSGDYTRVEIGMNAVVRLLSNKLIFQLTPKFKHFNYTGYHDISRNPFSATIYAAYYLGNFNFDGYYQTREHNLNSTDGAYAGNRSAYFLRVGWNHRNLNLSISANNFARTNGYDGNWQDIITPLYSNHTVSYTSNYHAFYAISAVYTFGYGKKIQQGNEVGRQNSAGSAIMK